jgi:hypothetical protein
VSDIAKMDCLKILQEKTNEVDAMLRFLNEEKLISNEQYKTLYSPNTAQQYKDILIVLKNLSNDERIQLLEFEWVKLPQQKITVTIVTDKEKRDFTYTNY